MNSITIKTRHVWVLAVAALLVLKPALRALDNKETSLFAEQREWVSTLCGLEDDVRFMQEFEKGMAHMFHTRPFLIKKGRQYPVTQSVDVSYGRDGGLALIRQEVGESAEYNLGQEGLVQVISVDDEIDEAQSLDLDENAVVVLRSKADVVVVDFRNKLMHWDVVRESTVDE